MSRSWWVGIGVVFALGCHKPGPEPEEPVVEEVRPELPEVPFPYSAVTYPERWLSDPAMNLFHVSDADNPITDAGATLGRVLFYDPQLSANMQVSCATCHRPDHGFADDGAVSEGIGGGMTHRNSMALINLAYQRRLFWEAREADLESQVLQPIAHPDEMGMDLAALPIRLAGVPHYADLFVEAFGDDEITVERVARALAQFLRSMQTTSSRYDAGLDNDFSQFTPQELEGMGLFFNGETRCAQCHGTLNFFTPSELMVNGLEVNYAAAGDGGLADLTGNPDQDGLFRVVSLRNVGLTAPYMHDGRFATLREVVDFYADGIQPHPGLNHRLSETGIGPDGQAPMTLPLNSEQREALVAFLHTLSDTTDFVHSPWGSPF